MIYRYLLLSTIIIIVSNALIQTTPRQCTIRRYNSIPTATSSTVLYQWSNNKKTAQSQTRSINGSSVDLFKTLELKDEALMQAQTAVSSLENALESAVTNLENLQQQLQMQVIQLEEDLRNTKDELGTTQLELEATKAELQNTQEELAQSLEEISQLEMALQSSELAAQRAAELEVTIQEMKERGFSDENTVPAVNLTPAKKDTADKPWQIFAGNQKVIPVLNEWIAIKGANEGEIQISGKVTNHPTISDGDAIVTSPLMDADQAVEKKIVTTLSGSKYRLGVAMTMPASDSASQKITSQKKKNKQKPQSLVNARSSITLPDLSGNTLGNGRYLLSGEATSSINGRSYIQTAYRASPLGRPVGYPLAIKYSSNTEAMKREIANYQKVERGLPTKRGSFIKRVEFLPLAGNEMPDKSAIVMERGVADVKAFMPKVGGKLEGELLMDCALTALRCVEALHSVRLVWNDLKTENFVVIEDQKGGVSFKGIDLESAMPVKNAPVDYTPEACPPEFATSFLNGEVESFSLEYSYDVWSFGMFLYEISTGRGFFDGISAQRITEQIPTFQPNLIKVTDPLLSDLISQCLSLNPKDRPSLSRIFKHPYFADSQKNPFDFLFGQ